MNDPDAFDAFYKDTRTRLLVQTVALTGDLTAARGAVRDAFVMGWHHWRKVSQLDDPEAWARAQAWNHAQRRATARIWNRNKFDPDLSKTLQSLGKLPLQQRKVLLLAELSELSMPEVAREVGTTYQRAESDLQVARTQFAVNRGSTRPPIQELLLPLNELADEARWPRPSILRRAGAARRRTHTTIGIIATVVTLLIAGVIANDGGTSRPKLSQEQISAGPEVIQIVEPPVPEARLAPADLLSPSQVNRLAPNAIWGPATTHDNTAGDGLVLPCQQARFADPAGLGALVRDFTSTPARRLDALTSATQFTELSADDVAAAATYTTTLDWYAGCATPRVQLLKTEKVVGVGDMANLLTLRSWSEPVTTYTVGLAQTGQLTTTTIASVGGKRRDVRTAMTSLLAASVNEMCATPGAGACAAPPARRTITPIPVGEVPGMISEVDLPPVSSVDLPWVGTGAEPATVNVAATRCDETSFTAPPVTAGLSRTFLIPGARLPREFGLTQTVGVAKRRVRAEDFVTKVKDKMARCEENNLGTTVTKLAHLETLVSELDVWELRTEVSESQTVRFMMAIMRHNSRVAQLGFVPVDGVNMAPGAFVDLAQRGLARLPDLPRRLSAAG